MTSTPIDIAVHILRSLEVYELSITPLLYKRIVHKKKSSREITSQEILNEIVNGIIIDKVKLCRDNVMGKLIGFYKGLWLAKASRKGTIFNYSAKDSREYCQDDFTKHFIAKFVNHYPRKPIIMFDALLWELHHDKEKKKALTQLLLSINTIRQYLTDLNIAVLSPSHEVIALFKSFRNAIALYNQLPHDLIRNHKVVILDPYAHEKLTESDIMSGEVFIIGLLVDDMFPRPFATYAMNILRGLDVERKSILYKDSVIGVPKEINKIVEIVLSVRFNGKSLNDAIRDAMGIDNKIYRIVYEALKICKTREELNKIVKKLMEELHLDEKYYKKVLARIRNSSCRGA
ncbi:hypothetical protein QPL79_07870 [Ignisphaera sp. 4213-co]|uniref:SAM-dependent MTase TRM10-type domain-containing protein n=1 Tax=Ignisphaera cupida TaxID=3050454 RepID=A0ABD4Z7R5_9CREN|nr:hypothetical protein [Ignisphaera sp. 4213-co]MDK6029279.1 hypothetical protein [Ignisphaera sp. 4213-co]